MSIIEVKNISKLYQLGATVSHDTLRDAIAHGFKSIFKRRSSSSSHDSSHRSPNEDIIWALKDVSFEVQQGEVLGIIGRNGAGKSTLLKILSRITEPTEGEIRIKGRVSSLLEVGTGFHPELTGRENIFLNGAVLGMTRQEIKSKFDEIVAFAETEKFLDTPVKRYSSGMKVRLAFAVAAHLEPEILIIDEVLAVGDAAFQKKCLGKMENVAKEGRTVLFVSHNMGAINSLCERVLCIENGAIIEDGKPQNVISKYTNLMAEGHLQGKSYVSEHLIIEKVILRNSAGKRTTDFYPCENITVEIYYYAHKLIEKPHFWISIRSNYGSLFQANMLLDGFCPEYVKGKGSIKCIFKSPPLLPQVYSLRIGARGKDGVTVLTATKEVGFFNIIGKMKEFGLNGELADMLSWDSAPMIIPYDWRFPDGQIISVKINSDFKRGTNE